MGRKSKWEYLKAIYRRYQGAERALRQLILEEFCQVCGYQRKYALRLLNGPPPQKPQQKRRARTCTYGSRVIGILSAIWETAGAIPGQYGSKPCCLCGCPGQKNAFQ